MQSLKAVKPLKEKGLRIKKQPLEWEIKIKLVYFHVSSDKSLTKAISFFPLFADAKFNLSREEFHDHISNSDRLAFQFHEQGRLEKKKMYFIYHSEWTSGSGCPEMTGIASKESLHTRANEKHAIMPRNYEKVRF